MFKSNGEEDYNENVVDDTVIGQSIKIEGDLVSNGSITVEGEVIGSVKTEQTLKIGERAKVKAEVNANEAFVSGKVSGNIVVKGKLELSNTAEVNGDIEASTLQIDAGAVFNGRCSMTDNASPTSAEGKDPSSPEATKDKEDQAEIFSDED
ncbi:polymer-forming cytoskeletal protein [Candidatus Falkowbacteria bacterium]|jgi:cytoskeletal protein CcmA (bactofilin family)|nr:polymer-forming cytoskeletal protein [Candidatus Falkowbacteria bacterium]MBT5503031.1 polymer-forming cytoskeletal protein [Candidatus Falkowbacteria bacterium]MBT7349021.1 polymer-forming cytoskeletal protein [Candidatus Falkowbacteria bacterium]MBT7500986.1 polymer-forming cytoskeletal protein [Candidatus Falkowbacteria bacterium]